MSQPPSKLEILLKYRDVIAREDFDILIAYEIPQPEEARKDGAFFQYLGNLNGWRLILKRTIGGTVAVICFMGGGFIPGLEYLNDYSRIAYTQVSDYLADAIRYDDSPATQCIAVDRPNNWALPPEAPIRIATTTTTQSPSTTTTQPTDREMPPGSGFIPNSGQWPGWA